MTQSMISSAGKPGRFTRAPDGPVKASVKNTGFTSDGTKVDGTRGMSFKLRSATPHVTAAVDIRSSPAGVLEARRPRVQGPARRNPSRPPSPDQLSQVEAGDHLVAQALD